MFLCIYIYILYTFALFFVSLWITFSFLFFKKNIIKLSEQRQFEKKLYQWVAECREEILMKEMKLNWHFMCLHFDTKITKKKRTTLPINYSKLPPSSSSLSIPLFYVAKFYGCMKALWLIVFEAKPQGFCF